MGLFDSLTIECELPVADLPQTEWQTKDFDRDMSSFILSQEGRLLQIVPAIELRNGKVRPTGKIKKIDRNYEGCFSFYNMVDNIWHEFEVVMIDGEVRLIRKKE